MRTPVVQPVAGLLHQRPAQVVAAHAAVAVREAGAGRDDERRVGDDQVVRLGADRLEEGTLAQIGRGGTGQGEGQPGEDEGSGVEVGGRDPGGVLRGVQRLDAGARTDVERGGDRRTDGDPGECAGRPTDTEDDPLLVRTDATGTADRAAQIGDDEPVLALRSAVRPHIDGGPHLVVLADHPAVLDALGQRECGAGPLVRDGTLEQEKPHQRVERRAATGGTQRRNRLTAGERGVGGRTEQVEESVGGEGGGKQGFAEPGRTVGRGEAGRTHPPIVAAPADNGTGPAATWAAGPVVRPPVTTSCWARRMAQERWARPKPSASGSRAAWPSRCRPHRTGASAAPRHRWC